MPFVYNSSSAVNGTNFTTNAVANTEGDYYFIKAGTRNVGVQAMYVGGKGAGLTAISGIAYRLKAMRSTATTLNSGTALTPTQRDPGAQNPKATAATSTGVGAGNSQFLLGTGAVYIGGCISGAAGPGGWVAPNADSLPTLEGSANQSIDLFTSSGTISLNFEFVIEHVE
jgi:hypothetical protein